MVCVCVYVFVGGVCVCGGGGGGGGARWCDAEDKHLKQARIKKLIKKKVIL